MSSNDNTLSGDDSIWLNNDDEMNSTSASSNTDLSEKAMDLPKHETWQNFAVWRVSLIGNNMCCVYSSIDNKQIFISRNSLERILTTVKNEILNGTNGKNLYQFQEPNSNFISSTLAHRVEKNNPN